MGTTIRPEISKKNKYWIDRERYYELKHFCSQYNTWKHIRSAIDGYPNFIRCVGPSGYGNKSPTEIQVELREYYTNMIEMVENTALKTDAVIGGYILRAVTNSLSYEVLRAQCSIPCNRDEYYELYRKFFWLLDVTRDKHFFI